MQMRTKKAATVVSIFLPCFLCSRCTAFSTTLPVGPRLHVPPPWTDQNTAINRRSISTRTFGSKKPSLAQQQEEANRSLGVLVLLTVPFAWGSFEPAVRYVYAMDPPVPAILFSCSYYLVATCALALFVALAPINPHDKPQPEESSLSLRGGVELGSYLFFGNGLQVLGLKTVPADRAAFLLQLTTIFVPLVQAILNKDIKSISNKTWGASFLALVGILVLTLDASEDATTIFNTLDTMAAGISQGDALVVSAALAYTFHCIRLERFAKELPPVKLAASKAATECTWSLLLLLALVVGPFSQPSGAEVLDYLHSDIATNPGLTGGIVAVLWTGLVTVAYTIYAQSFGQARVKATDANLIYTIQPICTALFAWLLLDETLGLAGYLGGSLIGGAVYIVANDNVNNPSEPE